ncbi:hypothetical protein [Nonomuraea sp. NPDC003214]
MRLPVRLWVMLSLTQSHPPITPPGQGGSAGGGVRCPHRRCGAPQQARPPRHTCVSCGRRFLVARCRLSSRNTHYMVNGGPDGWRCDVDGRILGHACPRCSGGSRLGDDGLWHCPNRHDFSLLRCPWPGCGLLNVPTGDVMTCVYCDGKFRTS